MLEENQPWFRLTLRETETPGLELPKLSRLLDDLSSTFYAIARAKAGLDAPRPGPRTPQEEALAGIRLVRVEPGSAVIELAPPPPSVQVSLLTDEPTADDVALEFVEELQRIEAGDWSAGASADVRRRIRNVVRDVTDLGSMAEVEVRPISPRAQRHDGHVVRAVIQAKDLPVGQISRRETRRRRLSGHAYMADVEPGRQKLRIKAPDGRDVTLDVADELIPRISQALDKVVEVEIDEELEDEHPIARVVQGMEILPSAGPGSDRPPKSIEELQREQNLPKERPDYAGLASAIWQTEAEVDGFQEYLRAARHAEP